ncbi:hypothetical protein L226DRAFT_474661, partial [Lentinus tigrinus ALCF2SS1-7]|uniref:uncharacterized protein n=1 Tax=Lentinus tigrinus ALCF2SS1-7 TaxID=1328758 RepID=UPI00116637F2
EEFIVKVQGFLLHMLLPPVRPFQCTPYRLPRNPNRLIDMRQSVTVTGLGCEAFEKAVAGLSILYQTVKAKIMQRGGQLRDWTPVNLGDDEGNATLTFGSRYLTAAKDVGNDDIRPDLAEVIDPFNILRPLLRTEVHTLDNCVQYWQRMPKTSEGQFYERTTPDAFYLSNMVEIKFAIHIVKVGRQEYVFLPKLRALCLLGKEDYNIACIRSITQKTVSPLKKVKRKVGYEREDSEEDRDGPVEPPQKAMKRLTLAEGSSSKSSLDSASMQE